ncbi:MAG TPA: NB-ARC domain-containing protein [Jatrophihabitans sp.]|nr:NB-ARC domain-containing protein [Jatrophihabitans sp.]
MDDRRSASGPDPARIVSLDDLARELGLLRSRAARGTRSARVSLEDLAGRVGEPRSTIHAYLTGKRLAPAQVLDRMVIALGASSAEQHEWAEAWYRVTAYRDAAHRGTGAEPATRTAVAHQLPLAVDNFTGRTAELAELSRLLAQGRPGLIAAVSGPAGAGKTALAVHWAHVWSENFPDGQLYVDLRGFDPELPVQPGQALAGFLRALGVPGSEIPRELAERAALYRSLLSGRRMLILLDNARDVEHVRSLLPGAPACAVLVTSRDSLTGLIARHGGHRVELDVLPPEDAVQLLRALIGTQVDAAPAAAEALVEHCARLPLALRIAAELVGHRPGLQLADLVSEFASGHPPLDLLVAGDDARTSIRAVFSWSYSRLPGDAGEAFRLLGLHPGADLQADALAALSGTATLAQARHTLGVLTRANLVRQSAPDRYGMHELLHAYAGELAVATEAGPHRRIALTRLLDHYLHTAAHAMQLLFPHCHHRRPDLGHAHPLTAPLTDVAAARGWLDAERANLVAVTVHAGRQGWPQHAIGLAETLAHYLDSGGHVAEALLMHGSALAAARLCDDRAAEAIAVENLAIARGVDEPDDGELPYGALGSYRHLRDPAGQNRVLRSLDSGGEASRPAAAASDRRRRTTAPREAHADGHVVARDAGRGRGDDGHRHDDREPVSAG